MKTLITGGAGFIGSHLVEQLIKEGYEPVVVDNFSTGQRINLPEGVKVYEMDINDKEIEKIFEDEKIEAVCHLAAATVVPKSVADPLSDIRTNVAGMVNLLEACKKYKIKKFVFSSTGGALYGDTNILPTPESHPTKPISPYGIDKLTGENYLYYYNKIHKMPTTVLRYSNVYGPRQDRKGEGGVVAIFIKKLIDKEQPDIFGTGEQTRDFVYVEDIARANLLALKQSDDSFHIYNIGKGKEDSVNELFEVIAKKLKSEIKANYAPARKGEISRSCLDSAKAKEEMGWIAQNSLEEGIDKTINYFLK